MIFFLCCKIVNYTVLLKALAPLSLTSNLYHFSFQLSIESSHLKRLVTAGLIFITLSQKCHPLIFFQVVFYLQQFYYWYVMFSLLKRSCILYMFLWLSQSKDKNYFSKECLCVLFPILIFLIIREQRHKQHIYVSDKSQ